jgi:hypothetical protein
MTRPLARPSGTIGVRALIGAAALWGVVATAGCPGTLDRSILDGGSPPPNVCDAPNMIFVSTGCAMAGCHPAGNTMFGAGLDLSPSGIVGRLLNQGPSTNTTASASCSMLSPPAKPYLVPNTNPAQGLLLEKVVQSTVPCGTFMPQVGNPLSSDQLTCLNAWATAVTTGVITQ